MIDEYDSGYYARNMYCIPCFDRKEQKEEMMSCSRCGTRMRRDEGKRRKGESYCGYCAGELERMEKTITCPLCLRPIESYQKTTTLANRGLVHASCAETHPAGKNPTAFCAYCGKETRSFTILQDVRPICEKCARAAGPGHDHTLLSSLMDTVGSMLG